MSGSTDMVSMKPVGPVAGAFLQSRAFISGIMGPVGSGKTITCCQKILRESAKQGGKRDRNGVLWRKARGVVIRDTYPNIDKNILPSWFRVVPRHIGKFTGDAPRTHRVQPVLRRDAEGAPVEMLDLTVEFRAIGDNSVEEALRGLEVNWAWLNEADTLPEGVYAYLTGRVGRFAELGETKNVVDPMIFMDFNAPDVDNWIYNLFVDKTMDPDVVEALEEDLDGRALIEFFPQPGAREPGAENIPNLPKGYYARQIALAPSKNYVDRMVDNKFAPVRHGQPVFPEFDFQRHVAPAPIEYDPARKLVVGMDAGLTPAAVFTQRSSLGQLRVLSEFAVFPTEEEMMTGVGPTRFGQALKRFIVENYPEAWVVRDVSGNPLGDEGGIEFWCDPAAKDGTDKSGNELSWMQVVAGQLKRRIRPAVTNKLHIRLEAVRKPMLPGSVLDGGQPAFLMSPGCRILRKGFLSGYHYLKVAVGDGTGRFTAEPNKNMFSHSQDALQYAAMADGSAVAEVLGRDPKRGRKAPRARVNGGTDYFAGETA